MIEILGSITGGLFFFLVPGMAWCILIFGREKPDALELICLSIALSISLSVLSIFFLNSFLGMRINLMNATLVLLVLTVLPLLVKMLRNGRAITGFRE